MKSRTNLRLCPRWLATLAAAAAAALALALPTTVYVYNHNPGDVFEDNAEGYIWQQLGLLDANGKPINVPESQIIRDPNGNVIGYKSADGTKEAYNVSSSATTAQAWQRVDPNGTLHIAKHGMTYRDDPNDPNTEHQGGGIRLDGGQPYDGFGTGTGVGYVRGDGTSGPYPLPPRPTAHITLIANACYSSHDSDGNGPETPVTSSGATVPGVSGTPQGHTGKVWAKCGVVLQGGTPQQQAAALEAMRAAARAAGFPPPPAGGGPQPATTNQDISNWVNSLPFATRYDTVQGVIDAAVPPAGTVVLKLTYTKDEVTPGGGGGSGGFYNVPTQINPVFAADVPYMYDESYAAASIRVNFNSLWRPGVFEINMWAELPTPPPEGMTLASGVFNFETINGNPIQSFVNLVFVVTAPPSQAQVLWFNPSTQTWAPPQGAVTIDPNGVVDIQTGTMGVYAAFAPSGAAIPSVTQQGLIIMTLLLLGIGILLVRRAAARSRQSPA